MVQLDPYVCDLNCNLDRNYTSVEVLSSEGFSYIWGGVKSTHGLVSGRAYFTIKLDINNEITDSTIQSEEMNPHQARLGFSSRLASTRLGEERDSYGFSSDGMKYENGRGINFGRPFFKGDKIGAYIDLSHPNLAEIFFTLNEEMLGLAYKLKRNPEDEFYPHIYLKNMKCSVNFGQTQQQNSLSDAPILPGFKLFNQLESIYIKRGLTPPSKPELIMTVGLPGCGKTTFSNQTADQNREKRYNILGTDFVIQNMKIGNFSRRDFILDREQRQNSIDPNNQKEFNGHDVMQQQAASCFSKLMKLAMTKCRNYILDQTNIFAYSRGEKAKAFTNAGFKVSAAVICLSPEELERRSTQRTEETGKFVPESAIHELMANCFLPSECVDCITIFTEVSYVEGDQRSCLALAQKYRRKAKLKGYEPNKKQSKAVRPEILKEFYQPEPATIDVKTVMRNKSPTPPPQPELPKIDFNLLKHTLSKIPSKEMSTAAVSAGLSSNISSQPVKYEAPTPAAPPDKPEYYKASPPPKNFRAKIPHSNSFSLPKPMLRNEVEAEVARQEKIQQEMVPQEVNKFDSINTDNTNYGFNLSLPENAIPIQKMREQIEKQRLELERMQQLQKMQEQALRAAEEQEKQRILDEQRKRAALEAEQKSLEQARLNAEKVANEIRAKILETERLKAEKMLREQQEVDRIAKAQSDLKNQLEELEKLKKQAAEVTAETKPEETKVETSDWTTFEDQKSSKVSHTNGWSTLAKSPEMQPEFPSKVKESENPVTDGWSIMAQDNMETENETQPEFSPSLEDSKKSAAAGWSMMAQNSMVSETELSWKDFKPPEVKKVSEPSPETKPIPEPSEAGTEGTTHSSETSKKEKKTKGRPWVGKRKLGSFRPMPEKTNWDEQEITDIQGIGVIGLESQNNEPEPELNQPTADLNLQSPPNQPKPKSKWDDSIEQAEFLSPPISPKSLTSNPVQNISEQQKNKNILVNVDSSKLSNDNQPFTKTEVTEDGKKIVKMDYYRDASTTSIDDKDETIGFNDLIGGHLKAHGLKEEYHGQMQKEGARYRQSREPVNPRLSRQKERRSKKQPLLDDPKPKKGPQKQPYYEPDQKYLDPNYAFKKAAEQNGYEIVGNQQPYQNASYYDPNSYSQAC